MSLSSAPDVASLARNKINASHHCSAADRLRDFSADGRLLILVAMAPVIGTAGAAAAWTLLHLIAAFTNLACHGRFSAAPATIDGHSLGLVGVGAHARRHESGAQGVVKAAAARVLSILRHGPPTGPREARPDDRLRRTIQRLRYIKGWITRLRG